MSGLYYGQFPTYSGDVPPVNSRVIMQNGRQPRVNNVLPYSPVIQTDEIEQNIPPGFNDRLPALPSSLDLSRIMPQRLPVKVHQAPLLVTITTVNVPVKIAPINNTRITIVIGNPSTVDTMYFSYGQPSFVNNVPIGLPVAVGETYAGLYGVSCIDEIWVWYAAGAFPRQAICYEGQLSIANINL